MGVERQAMITVGVDGSPESMVAAKWAAQEALRRRLSLEMLLGINEPLENHSGYVFPAPVIEAVRTVGRGRLHGAARGDPRRIPGPGCADLARVHRPPARPGDPVPACVDDGRGHPGPRTPSRRSSSGRWPCTWPPAHSPVAVIPPTAAVSATEPNGPVVVGVDGHPASVAAIGFAFDEAAVRQTTLLAALVFDELAYRGFAKGGSLIGRLEDDEERAVLAETARRLE